MHIEDSIRKRYFYKVLTNVLTIGLGVITVTIVPRALGAADYGNYNFLLMSLLPILTFMELNTSSALYTYASRVNTVQDNEPAFLIWFALIATLFVTVISALVLTGLHVWLWPGQSARHLVAIALLTAFLWLNRLLAGYSDAKAQTVISEKTIMSVKLITFIGLISLFAIHRLDINNYIAVQLTSMGILVLAYRFWLKRYMSAAPIRPRRIDWRSFWNYTRTYCGPLLIYQFYGMLIAFFDRWILQFASGSTQQGYYSLAFQFGTIINTLIVAFTPIYRREISRYNHANDHQSVRATFSKYLYLFYTMSAILSLLILFQAQTIMRLVGSGFSGSLLPFMIMCLYPMYQTYGNLCGEVFLATERTALYTKLGMITNTIGLLAAYFILAPHDFFIPGLALGAIGLALKMVVINVMHVHVLLFACCRILRLSFSRVIIQQLKVLALFGGGGGFLAWASRYLITGDIPAAAIFGLVYTGLTAAILFRFPGFINIEKQMIINMIPGKWSRILKLCG